MNVSYKTKYGTFYNGQIESFLMKEFLKRYERKVNLIFTSPPFPLNKKKRYGNLQGEEYVKWLTDFAPLFNQLLTEDGSIVIELGNSWEPKRPVMSTLSLRTLLTFIEKGELTLCQQFVWYNPAKLPTPAQWVNIERIRVKDSFTNIWWMSNSDNPKANNRNVLVEYSETMKKLLKDQRYNYGKRPSEHNIGEKSFLVDNRGAIPSNVIKAANTHSNTNYQKYCQNISLQAHPARMPKELPEFFIKFLTNPGDLVLDPFAGSNTTGAVAEELERNWIAVEAEVDYIKGSLGRFCELSIIEKNI